MHLVEREADPRRECPQARPLPEGADIPQAVAALAARLRSPPRGDRPRIQSRSCGRRAGTRGSSSRDGPLPRRLAKGPSPRHAPRPSEPSSLPRAPRSTREHPTAWVLTSGSSPCSISASGCGRSVAPLAPGASSLSAARARGTRKERPGPGGAARGCCETMMRQARLIREANPACGVTVLVREVNACALREELYTEARRAGVLFVRFDPAAPPRLEGPMRAPQRLTVVDTALGEPMAAPGPGGSGCRYPAAGGLRASGFPPGHPAGADGFLREWESKTRSPSPPAGGLPLRPGQRTEADARGDCAARWPPHGCPGPASGRRSRRRRWPERVEAPCAACLSCVRRAPTGYRASGMRCPGGPHGDPSHRSTSLPGLRRLRLGVPPPGHPLEGRTSDYLPPADFWGAGRPPYEGDS